MEAVIMKDIMNMATILIRNPKSIEDLCLGLFKENNSNDKITKDLESLKNKLDEVDKPIHPVDVFDMIVGTSTGKCYYLFEPVTFDSQLILAPTHLAPK